MTIHDLPTPAVLVDRARVDHNIQSMQAVCNAHGVELRPHIKTHKMVEVAKRQLAAGAAGLTCAKLSEAEAMLPSGVKELFIAHSLVGLAQAPRIAALMDKLTELRVGCTSEAHLEALIALGTKIGRPLQVMLGVDTGLGREGVRSTASAVALAKKISASPHVTLRGFYTHEGQLYGVSRGDQVASTKAVLDHICEVRDAIDPKLPVWPGCSVTARWMAATGRPQAVRPGSYVFSDLSLSHVTGVMAFNEAAVHILATVIDRPEPGLALIDAGSKTFSGDKTADGFNAIAADGRDISVVRVNEEHGYLRGADVDQLRVGDRLRFVPAHICTVINLTNQVTVISGDDVIDRWTVEARGCVT